MFRDLAIERNSKFKYTSVRGTQYATINEVLHKSLFGYDVTNGAELYLECKGLTNSQGHFALS